MKERDEARLKGAAAIGGRETGAGPVHWYEHYGAKNSRAWMVIDPADGRIPAQTQAAIARLGGTRGRARRPRPAAKVVAPTHGWIAASTIAASLADCPAR